MPNPADPFARFTTHQELPPRAERQEGDAVIISCKDCDDGCILNHHQEWVHVWEIRHPASAFARDYHKANPDIIDVEVVDVVPD